MTSTETPSEIGERLLGMTIRELTENYPQSMSVLSELGLDLCCGGGHQLDEALRLHRIDPSTVLPALQSLIENDKRYG